MVNGNDYLEKSPPWKYWFAISFLIWSIFVMLATVINAIVVLLIIIYKKIRGKLYTFQYLSKHIIPSLATLVLILGFILIASQEVYYMGKQTFSNFSLFISTWLFAILSLISLVNAIKGLNKPVKRFLKVYCMVIACTYVGLSFFLWYWGIIGLKLW
jgi:hypothetical protein